MGGAAGIVFGQPGVQVVGKPDIALFGTTLAAEDVDGPRKRWVA